ncbi:MAG: M15 family metallopeptidase [Hyphomicrobium sp.]|jgi:D-alanyl-D-alanine dipeptidase
MRVQLIAAMAVLSFSTALTPTCLRAQQLPEGFVYLRDVDETITQDIRYAGIHNFMGHRSAGYEGAECILTARAAEALHLVQSWLAAEDLSLKVYDCYRPARAVREFREWSRTAGDEAMRSEFFPEHRKIELFSLGYIATRSVHSRGCAVDLTVMANGRRQLNADPDTLQRACTAKHGERFDDGSLDMGTAYDCFSELSHTANKKISIEARQNRARLLTAMNKAGFQNYEREWWHFEYRKSCPTEAKDFTIVSRQVQSRSSDAGSLVASSHACTGTELLPKCPLSQAASVYDAPSSDGRVIGSLNKESKGVECVRCAEVNLSANSANERWCLVEFYDGGVTRRQGWVAGRDTADKDQCQK